MEYLIGEKRVPRPWKFVRKQSSFHRAGGFDGKHRSLIEVTTERQRIHLKKMIHITERDLDFAMNLARHIRKFNPQVVTKIRAISLINNGDSTPQEAAKKMQVSIATIYNWTRKYREGGFDLLLGSFYTRVRQKEERRLMFRL